MKIRAPGIAVAALVGTFILGTSVFADDYERWRNTMIDDALTAAPPSVTDDATIHAWDSEGKMHLLRHGSGVHNCVATGAFSYRIGLPQPPFPDPMCFDQNAWKFFNALWSEKNPLKPENPLPTAPGLVWMLAGMGVPGGMLRQGAEAEAQLQVDANGKTVAQLSPHIMIMPLPVNAKKSNMPYQYDTANPMQTWLMAAGSPIEHVMLHVSEDDVASMMGRKLE